MTINASNDTPAPQSGYDIPVYGLHNNTFYAIHIPAILCICASFICAITAIVLSFRRLSAKTFFTTWNKSNRFIVYLAVCDGLFNVSHLMDHVHIVIVKAHVYPKELCQFYAFNLAEFVTAQNLMVNMAAVNAFMLMYFQRNINFGRRDWRLLLWTFGAPFAGATAALITGQFGPTGAFCLFDAIKGRISNIFFTTAPLILILLMNSILYILTYKKIYDQLSEIQNTIGQMPATMQAAHRAARSMSLFVAAFFIQWWALGLYGLWGLFTDGVPQPLVHLTTIFSNIGGVLNLGVYILIIKRKNLNADSDRGTASTNTESTELS